MDENKLKASIPYIREVARRLRLILGEWLSYDELIALMAIIHWNSFEFPDGFILNDESDVNKEIWLADAGEVAAAFCPDAEKDGPWFKASYPAHGMDDAEYLAVHEAMLCQIKGAAVLIDGIDKQDRARPSGRRPEQPHEPDAQPAPLLLAVKPARRLCRALGAELSVKRRGET